MRTLTAFLLVAPAFVAHAAETPATNVVRAEAIRSHVEFLAGDLLEGRAAATRGYDIAAAYVAAQFRQAGLAPGGDNDTFLQAVPLLEATPPLPGASWLAGVSNPLEGPTNMSFSKLAIWRASPYRIRYTFSPVPEISDLSSRSIQVETRFSSSGLRVTTKMAFCRAIG